MEPLDVQMHTGAVVRTSTHTSTHLHTHTQLTDLRKKCKGGKEKHRNKGKN